MEWVQCPFVAVSESNMYAVIVSGGKQHRVKEGETLKLEKLEVATGEVIQFDKVLMVGEGESIKIGAPYVEGGQVTAEVLAQGRAKKVQIIKFNCLCPCCLRKCLRRLNLMI